ncbi:cupin domain-containing protein [Pseudomonas aeruginosa]|nr:cupin domain-containing protein [Pseudomonas aeruginosa]
MALTLLKNTAGADLGAASPGAGPLGEPVAQTRAYAVERTGQVETGIWGCTPGRWRRQIVEQEFCHFLQGRCTFTPDGGETIRIEAGDALLLPENSLGVWEVQETVRKSYVIIHR